MCTLDDNDHKKSPDGYVSPAHNKNYVYAHNDDRHYDDGDMHAGHAG